MKKRSECDCPCHRGLIMHSFPCCEPDEVTMTNKDQINLTVDQLINDNNLLILKVSSQNKEIEGLYSDVSKYKSRLERGIYGKVIHFFEAANLVAGVIILLGVFALIIYNP